MLACNGAVEGRPTNARSRLGRGSDISDSRLLRADAIQLVLELLTVEAIEGKAKKARQRDAMWASMA